MALHNYISNNWQALFIDGDCIALRFLICVRSWRVVRHCLGGATVCTFRHDVALDGRRYELGDGQVVGVARPALAARLPRFALNLRSFGVILFVHLIAVKRTTTHFNSDELIIQLCLTCPFSVPN